MRIERKRERREGEVKKRAEGRKGERVKEREGKGRRGGMGNGNRNDYGRCRRTTHREKEERIEEERKKCEEKGKKRESKEQFCVRESCAAGRGRGRGGANKPWGCGGREVPCAREVARAWAVALRGPYVIERDAGEIIQARRPKVGGGGGGGKRGWETGKE